MQQEPEITNIIKAVCGNCQMWKKVQLPGPPVIGSPAMGNCYLLPPTPAPIFDASMRRVQAQVNLRPIVAESDGCGMFAVREDLLAGANDA
jgi:hypothetical protein